jgi:tetratricopeptide (TPR) repeat protein
MTKMNRINRIKEYQSKSDDANLLVMLRKNQEAVRLLSDLRIQASTAGDSDYQLYFDAEIIGYSEPNFSIQKSLMEKALLWEKEKKLGSDPFILRQFGVYYSLVDKDVEAIALFDQALAINHQNYNLLRNKGVSLSKISKEEEAITFFDRALDVNFKDYHSLRYKGISLSKLRREEEAIACFRQALEIYPEDAYSLKYWAVSAYLLNDYDVCYDKIKLAVIIMPNELVGDFRLLVSLMSRDPDEEWDLIKSEIQRAGNETVLSISHQYNQEIGFSIDKLSDIRGFVGNMRDTLKENGLKFLDYIKLAKEKEVEFLKPESLLNGELSLLLILRKWNSYTPAIPSHEDERSRGGGYFIYFNGKGTVIDPGYNFIENLFEAGCRICDIDNIVITHAHNDHTFDFESLCTLLYKYNTEAINNGRTTKKVNIYMNNGSFKKFSGLLNLQDHFYIKRISTLNTGNHYSLSGDLELDVLPAFHDEVISRDQSIGLLFAFPLGDGTRKILFTSDTGLFPLELDSPKFKPDTNGKQEIWQLYPPSASNNLDMLIVHIGSINENEILVDPKEGIHKCLYPNHLGVIGTTRLITQLKPRTAIISEFGEEIKYFRCELLQQIQKIVKRVLKEVPLPKVIPGDIGFVYEIKKRQFMCCADRKWVDIKKIKFNYIRGDKENIVYFSEGAASKFRKDLYLFDDTTKKYRDNRIARNGMYFK